MDKKRRSKTRSTKKHKTKDYIKEETGINKDINAEINEELYLQRKENILAFVKDKAYKPILARDIALLMGVPSNEMNAFMSLVADLKDEGKVLITKRGKIMLPESLNLYTGIFKGTQRGFAFVEVEGMPEEVFIPASATNGAMHKDKVLIKIVADTSRRSEGEVVKIIEKGMPYIVGTFQAVKDFAFGFVVADNKKIFNDIYIPKGMSKGAVTGHKVLVDIIRVADDGNKPEGRIIEILGHVKDPGVDILSIIYEHNLPIDFGNEVYEEIEEIKDTIDDAPWENRQDLRALPMVTIDGEDAKDLDDAVSVKMLENGNYELGVYIADVSHYVQEKSPLDKEAYKRGTSVYLVDRVIPMLPHKLSNGICSLNAGEDRFALCAIMEIDSKGDVVSHDIKKVVINVNRRMTYTVVNDILTNDDSEYIAEYKELVPMFKDMQKLRNILFDKRIRRGAIEFASTEARIILDEKGKPIDIVKRYSNVATSIIEEFMLCANETVAEHFYWLELPFVYRSHEVPDEERYDKLREFVAKLGYVLKGSVKHSKSYQQLLKSALGKPEEMLVHKMTLRSMKQARYTAENGEHFGLGAKYYCHFTSPIRRYPDLIVHRMISYYLENKHDQSLVKKYAKKMPEIALKCSTRERVAEEAQRDADKYKICQYMLGKINQEFEGVISGATSWGIYVELPNTVEGMVSANDLYDDYYIYQEENLRYLGENFHKTYTIGDKVNVRVENVNLSSKTIDFVFTD